MANYNVDIQLQVQGLKKIDDLNKRIDRLNKETNNLQNKLTKGNPFNAAGVSINKYNAGLKDGISKTQQLAAANQKAANRQIKNLENLIKLRKELNRVQEADQLFRERRGGPSSPVGGRVNIPGSPAARRAGRARAGRGFQNAALGVGFPLLFGGGAGSIAGGLLGSTRGFGGQILGSAIGQQVDQAVAAIVKLGQALNPLTGDIDAVAKAAGLAGTSFASLLKEYEKQEGTQAALREATEALSQQIGQDGVEALQQFGSETQELANEFSRALTGMAASIADFITKTGFVKGITGAVSYGNRLQSGLKNARNDEQLAGLIEQRNKFNRGILFGGDSAKVFEAEQAIVARQKELEIAQKIEQTQRMTAAIEAEKNNELDKNLTLAKNNLIIAQGNNNLLDESVVAAIRANQAEEVRLALIEAQGDARARDIALLQGAIARVKLDAAIKEARDALNKKLTRGTGGGFNKEEAIQKALSAEKVKQFDLDLRLASIGKDRLIVVQDQLAAIDIQTALREKQIMISTEDERLQQAKLVTLSLQRDIQREQLKLEEQKIIKQRQLQDLQQSREQRRSLRGISTDITRRTADAGRLTTGNSFEDAQLELRISQVRRQEDAITRLTDALQDQRDIRSKLTKDQTQEIKTTDQEIINLEERIELTKQLLPQLDAAEQAQLKFNQALEAAKPFADAFTSGLLDGMVAVVDGTKTAEQAFADFLNSIAKMLMQTAQQMIAQYIAISIARTFAGIGGGGQAGSDISAITKYSGIGANTFVPARPKALGGSVSGNRPYLVGERGPELFVPGAQGNIVPNNAMGGVNVGTINISVENTGEQLSPQAQKQLAGQVRGIVLGTLASERRSGGML